MPVGLPAVSADRNKMVVLNSSLPLGVQIAINPTGTADGSYNVNWCITGGTLDAAESDPSTQIPAGSMHMLPTDSVAKLLYVIRGAWMEALKSLTMQQIVPPASALVPNSSG